MVDRKQLEEWFRTGKTPTEAQFKEFFASYWHKKDKLPTPEEITEIIRELEEIKEMLSNSPQGQLEWQ